MIEELRSNSDAKALNGRTERFPEVGYDMFYAVNVTQVVTGDLLENQGSVCNASGQWSTRVERPGKRNYAALAYPAVRGHETNGSTVGCGIADAAIRVRAQSRVTLIHCDSRCGAAR